MTHDELLHQIDLHQNGQYSNAEDLTAWDALRAVVELHKPDEFGAKTCQAHDQCWGCGEWGGSEPCPCDSYPCPTIQAIEKELE